MCNKKENTIEIPFGAKDSELYKFEYSIPEGYEAEIKDGKVIVKKKESEDERIRKMLIEQMERWKKCAEDNNVEQDIKDASAAIAYLEKQKEAQPGDEDRYMEGYMNGMNDALKEQKPIPTEDEKDFLEKEVKAFLCNYDKEFDDDAPTYDIAEHFYQLGKNSQKPAEWNKDDELYFQNLIMAVDSTFSEGNTKIWLLNRFKSLRPQPKQEWSEEDRKMLDAIIKRYSFPIETDFSVFIGEDNLKDMREELGWIKSLRPQPHWKPSEKQMKALKVVARGFPADDPDAIDSLLTDLQKLL